MMYRKKVKLAQRRAYDDYQKRYGAGEGFFVALFIVVLWAAVIGAFCYL